MNHALIQEQLESKNFFKPREPLYMGAYNALRFLIINNFIATGERLDFSALEDLLQISRVPLREAIQLLVARGLVVHSPNNGTYVITLKEQDITEICDIRLMLEMHGLELSIDAIPREKLEAWLEIFASEELVLKNNKEIFETPHEIKVADAELHNGFILYSNRPILLDVYSRIEDYIILMRNINKRIVISSKEHIHIIDAILGNDLEKAKKLLQEHLDAVKVQSLQHIKEQE